MIRRLFAWILDRTLGWLWRMHERSVFCDTAIDQRADDLDFAMKHFGAEFKEQVDQMARDLFLDNASSTSTHVAQPGPDLPEDFAERMKWMIDALKPPKPEDLLKMIVVTTETPPGSILDCRYKEERYVLIHPEDWEKVKQSISSRPADQPVSPLYGIPVVHNDELAREILIGAIAEGWKKKQEQQRKARWN